MSAALPSRGTVNVAEINPYAPRPYTFTEAALCLRDSIVSAGYSSEVFHNRTDANRPAIVLGALPPHLPAVDHLDPLRTVIFNLEQLASASPVIAQTYRPWLERWLVADYHRRNIEWLQREHGGSHVAIELPLVPGPSVVFRPDLPRTTEVDVLFYGTPNDRRRALIERMRQDGLRVEVVEGAFGAELAPAIKRTKVVVHAHYYDTGLFPVTRILQPVAQGVPLVCEDAVQSECNDWTRSGIVFAPYEELANACKRLVASAEECESRAARNREYAARIDFASPFEQLLQALARRRLAGPPPPFGISPPRVASTPTSAPAPAMPASPSIAQPALQDDAHLSDEAIEAILAEEATALPAESHLPAPPLKLVERQPGQGRYGMWLIALLVVFSLFTIWRSMRA